MIAKGENRQHGGNLGYEDIPDTEYSRDDTVSHYGAPQPSDGVVIWDGVQVLGASTIDEIHIGFAEKTRLRCPSCHKTKIKIRSKASPKYKCHNSSCGQEFEYPLEQQITVRTYKTNHAAGWIDLLGALDGRSLRGLCKQPNSQHSIRLFNWPKFLSFLSVAERRNLIMVATI